MSEQTLPLEYYVNISLTNDKLVAYAQLSNLNDKFSCSVAQLEQLLESHRIIHGVKRGSSSYSS